MVSFSILLISNLWQTLLHTLYCIPCDFIFSSQNITCESKYPLQHTVVFSWKFAVVRYEWIYMYFIPSMSFCVAIVFSYNIYGMGRLHLQHLNMKNHVFQVSDQLQKFNSLQFLVFNISESHESRKKNLLDFGCSHLYFKALTTAANMKC